MSEEWEIHEDFKNRRLKHQKCTLQKYGVMSGLEMYGNFSDKIFQYNIRYNHTKTKVSI
jgi:hypothetical protein